MYNAYLKHNVDLNVHTYIKRNSTFVNIRVMWGTKLYKLAICYKLSIGMVSYSRRL
jgi:hypothetical protein